MIAYNQIELIIDLIGTPSEEDIEGIPNERTKNLIRKFPKKNPKNLEKEFPKVDPLGLCIIITKITILNLSSIRFIKENADF